MVGSTVFLDLNRNGKLDDGEPNSKTDGNGKYNFTLFSTQKRASKSGYAPIIIMGGTDSGNAKKFRGRMRAPLSLRRPIKKVNVTPVTTVVAHTIEETITEDTNLTDEAIEATVTEAKLKVSQILNIEVTKLGADPIEEAEKGDKTLLKVSLQIHKSIELATELIDFSKSGGEEGAYSFVYKSFSSTLITYTYSTSLETIFDAMVDSKLESKIDKSKSKSFFKNKIKSMIVNTSGFFSGSGIFNMQKLSVQFEQVMGFVSVGNFSFNLNLITNMTTADYILIYNKNILSQYMNISSLTDLQINSFFGGGIASIDNLNSIMTNFDSFTSTLTLTFNIDDLQFKDVSTEVKKYLEWDTGYCANVYIRNMGLSSVIWSVDMNISGKIFNSWNVEIADKQEFKDTNRTTFTASGKNWNKTVYPFSDRKFGYCVFNDIANGAPADVNETSAKFEIVKGKKTSWSDGYCEEIIVKNSSNDVIDWTINNFDLDNSSYTGYYKSWGINYNTSTTGKLTSIKDKNSNSYLLPNQSSHFNYCASSVANKPFIVDLYEKTINSWSDKSTGSCNEVKVRNITANPIKNWKLTDYNMTGYAFHTWDSALIDSSEHKISVKGDSANLHINGWGSTTFGYCATNTELTVSDTITTVEKDKEVTYGNCTYTRVINNGDEAVKWKYELNSEIKIDSASNANMLDNDNDSYTFSGIEWNEVLAPSETTSFSYCHGTTQLTKIKIGSDVSYINANGYFQPIEKNVIDANNFDEIDDKLANFYDVTVDIRNSNLVKDGTKDINVAVVINRFNPDYEDYIDIQLLAIVPLTLSKIDNNVTITAKADSNVTLIARRSDDSFISSTMTNRSEDVKTTTTLSGDKSFTISAGSILNKFAQASLHPEVSNYIKDVILRNVTTANSYDLYVLFSDNTFDADSPIILNKVDGGRDISYLMRIPVGSEMDKQVLDVMGTDLRGYWGMIDLVKDN